MFVYATEVLHLSEAEAYLRIAVARAARKFPSLLSRLGDGRLHLSAIALLASHLTSENCEEILGRAEHKSKRQIEELVAELAPRPDVPPVIRKLPTPNIPSSAQQVELRPERVEPPPAPRPASEPAPPPVKVEPLAPERYKVTFTASAELRRKLERLQELTRDDLAAVIEAAVTEKLEKLEAKRYAGTKAPRKTAEGAHTSAKSRYIPAAVKRQIWKRDGGQCRFISREGRRCPERRGLEFHHEDPFGRGGDHDPSKMCLLCRSHNDYFAEREYGKARMNRYRRKGNRVSEAGPAYGFLTFKWKTSTPVETLSPKLWPASESGARHGEGARPARGRSKVKMAPLDVPFDARSVPPCA
jgi:predicted transcriptional regulator